MLIGRLIVAVPLSLGCTWAGALGIHRCVENGKTVFSDKPCIESVRPDQTPISEKGVRRPVISAEMSDYGYKIFTVTVEARRSFMQGLGAN